MKIDYKYCTYGLHMVPVTEIVKNTCKCKKCFKEYHKPYEKKYYDKNLRAKRLTKLPKTRVCKCCGKRKNLQECFYKQKPPRIPKFKPDYRWDCKLCQQSKSRKAYLKRTTKEERRKYMTNYFRIRNNVLPSGYRAQL